jgi:hypothetical protein
VSRIFSALDRLDSQWLATWLMSALGATLVLFTVLSAAVSPLVERTSTSLTDLQLAGLYPWLADGPEDGTGARALLRRWKDADVLDDARTGQLIDFAFPIAYGLFCLGLAAALWRAHPKHPRGGRWVWGIGLGTLAALLDEGENAFLWWMLVRPDEDPGRLVPALATTLAIGKYALLAAVVPILFLALRRARGTRA